MSRNLIPTVGLALVLLFFAMCWAVVGDAGFVAGSPVEAFGMFGATLTYAMILASCMNIFIAAHRAHRAGSWFWFFTVIFIWPASYVYTLVVNRNG
jgi:hypothetical protein